MTSNKMTRNKLIALLRAAILIGPPLVAPPALARSAAPPSAAVRAACAGDVRAYCAGVQPGGGRILRCMNENRGKLSEACRNAIVQAQSKK
jgi:hypothetical protein